MKQILPQYPLAALRETYWNIRNRGVHVSCAITLKRRRFDSFQEPIRGWLGYEHRIHDVHSVQAILASPYIARAKHCFRQTTEKEILPAIAALEQQLNFLASVANPREASKTPIHWEWNKYLSEQLVEPQFTYVNAFRDEIERQRKFQTPNPATHHDHNESRAALAQLDGLFTKRIGHLVGPAIEIDSLADAVQEHYKSQRESYQAPRKLWRWVDASFKHSDLKQDYW